MNDSLQTTINQHGTEVSEREELLVGYELNKTWIERQTLKNCPSEKVEKRLAWESANPPVHSVLGE